MKTKGWKQSDLRRLERQGAIALSLYAQGPSNPEYASRIDAERVTLEFAQKSARPLDAGKEPIGDSPLFGGQRQEDLF